MSLAIILLLENVAITSKDLYPMDTTIFIPFSTHPYFEETYQNCASLGATTIAIGRKGEISNKKISGVEIDSMWSDCSLNRLIDSCKTENLLLFLDLNKITLLPDALHRFQQVLRHSDSAWCYSDLYEYTKDNSLSLTQLSEYQFGSVRDDFNFGSVIGLHREKILNVLKKYGKLSLSKSSALYELRLLASLESLPFHIREPLYIKKLLDSNQTVHDSIFAYVDPSNRERQIELETVFTRFSKEAKFYLPMRTQTVDHQAVSFPVEASVIIPVKNRVRTVADAIKSALGQKASFSFNVIVVDNFSTDGTSEVLQKIGEKDSRLIVKVPGGPGLGIGGCWNEAIKSPQCGRFSVQLDSDDIYTDQYTLQKVINVFLKEKTAAVVGSYRLVNFELKDIPPGLIDHKEWTDENGHNNALRINGLGAPRAFFTPVLREILLPNVSYGEDYAAMLAITRNYKISRIYEPIYLCRRWEGNSEAQMSSDQLNRHNAYKDSLRTMEIFSRKHINQKNG